MIRRKPTREAKSLANALRKSGVLTDEQARHIRSLLADGQEEEAGRLLEKVLGSSRKGLSGRSQAGS
jgi:hypothetical protein